MEYIDILNPDGSPAGFNYPRNKAHAEGLFHKSIHLWIVNTKGELLIQKRSLSKTAHAGLWDISCAGHVESGDTSEATVIKEAKEELGLEISIDDIKFCRTILTKNIYDSGRYIDNEYIDIFLMIKNISISDICFDQDEVSDVRSIHLKDFMKLVLLKDPRVSPHYDEYSYMFDFTDLKYFLNIPNV